VLSPEAESKIIALCERVGMPWEKVPGRHEPWHGWNGVALNLGGNTPASSLAARVAPPARIRDLRQAERGAPSAQARLAIRRTSGR
jgi:hypothetical protein